MDCVWWHAIVNMSWFVALVQDPDYSHTNPYDCAGFQYFKQLLMPGKAANATHANHYTCTNSQKFKQLLTLGKAFDNSHANPYACAGSDNAKNSLCRCRLPTIHTQILTLVQFPDN
ncbi:hypothetical protein O181_090010 [Austropuccinia psidii MF-1]|uniref:Uncharacterized protein n=1 Tax=Austropuccinia psidii MF-1 TaxID=1389203 RepID=A0A9Q3P6P1_9BASI|nr:hypothetical protein [Austropuccinia psidii MF-1]